MNKALSLLTSFIVMLVLTIGSHISGQAAPQMAVMPNQLINIAHFFKPPNMAAGTAADNFGMLVLTNGDHNYRNQLAASGFSSTIPEYFRSDGIQDPGSCTASPTNNQVAYNPGDFCFISQNHPDWFLLDQYDQWITVTSGGQYYRMDPANPGWREFFLTRVVESQNQDGWTGLFLDNVEGGLGKFYGPKPAKYPDNASYQNAIAGFLEYLYVNYSQRYGRPIIGNIVARADDQVWFTYLQHLDGAMQERFAVDWYETSYLSADQWQKDMAFFERTEAMGKNVILVAPGYQTDYQRQNFAFASYLLISNGKAAFRYSTSPAYRDVWPYNNYKLNLGTPVGPRYQSGATWRRDFTRGNVVVDPLHHTAVISASGPQTPSPIGVFRPSNGALYLKNENTVGFADYTFTYGRAGDYPISGDWNGAGRDTIGIYRNGVFYLRNSNASGYADISFPFGAPGDQPVAGDWNGDGKDTIGVFRPSNGVIFLKNTNQTGYADIALNYGLPGDKPVTGDWNNDGKDTIGVYRGSTFDLRNSNTVGSAEIWFPFGMAGDMPISGNWDGS